MTKSKRKLSLDRETLRPLQPDSLGHVAGGVLPNPGTGASQTLVCSNCTSLPVPSPRPPTGGVSIPISLPPRTSGVICGTLGGGGTLR